MHQDSLSVVHYIQLQSILHIHPTSLYNIKKRNKRSNASKIKEIVWIERKSAMFCHTANLYDEYLYQTDVYPRSGYPPLEYHSKISV